MSSCDGKNSCITIWNGIYRNWNNILYVSQTNLYKYLKVLYPPSPHKKTFCIFSREKRQCSKLFNDWEPNAKTLSFFCMNPTYQWFYYSKLGSVPSSEQSCWMNCIFAWFGLFPFQRKSMNELSVQCDVKERSHFSLSFLPQNMDILTQSKMRPLPDLMTEYQGLSSSAILL